jgi:hypothetical protein
MNSVDLRARDARGGTLTHDVARRAAGLHRPTTVALSGWSSQRTLGGTGSSPCGIAS